MKNFAIILAFFLLAGCRQAPQEPSISPSPLAQEKKVFQAGEVFADNDFAELEQWLDPDNAMMASLALDTLPVTILYDAEGNELFRVIGGMDWAGERADTLISGAIGAE